MKASADCLTLIKSFESCKLDAYPDPKTGGQPFTCGWGATGPDIKLTTMWTQMQADYRLASDVGQFEAVVNKSVTHSMTQGQFDAFVSLVFNIGPGSSQKDGIVRLESGQPSTLLRMFNAGDIGGCETQWMRWCSPGTSVTHGLLRRRQAELELFRRTP